MDMASPVREQIFIAIRTFTCATVSEAEEAAKAIVRIVDNSLPNGGVNVSVSAAPVIRDLIAAEIENTERFKVVNGNSTDGHIALMREAHASLAA